MHSPSQWRNRIIGATRTSKRAIQLGVIAAQADDPPATLALALLAFIPAEATAAFLAGLAQAARVFNAPEPAEPPPGQLDGPAVLEDGTSVWVADVLISTTGKLQPATLVIEANGGSAPKVWLGAERITSRDPIFQVARKILPQLAWPED